MSDALAPSDVPAGPRRLAGAPLVLVVPASLADRWDIALAVQVEHLRPRATAAALGMCWPRFFRRHPYRGDVLAYGKLVVDALLAEGATFAEILSAGAEAMGLCLEALVDVEGAEGFSEPPT